MPKCELTGKKRYAANNVSHANNKTRKFQYPNVQAKRLWVPEEEKFVQVTLSTRALRSVTRTGLYSFIRKNGLSFKQFGLSGQGS